MVDREDWYHAGGVSFWGALLLMAAILGAMAFVVFPYDADATYALYDPVWYGEAAVQRPAESIFSHHLLFHVCALSLAQPLHGMGVQDAGPIAIRIISVLGTLGLAALLLILAGPRHRLVATLAILALVATRGFFMEATLGENVLPACAAALLCLICAWRGKPLRCLIATTVFALLWRQDNLFIIPGVLVLSWPLWPKGQRLRQAALYLGISGVITLSLYAVTWWLRSRSLDSTEGFREWLVHLGANSWNPGLDPVATKDGGFSPLNWLYSWRLEDVRQHLSALGYVFTGRQFARWEWAAHGGIGIAGLGLVLLGMRLCLGRGRSGRFLAATLAVLLVRTPFFLTYEPGNLEWWLLPVVLLVAAVLATRFSSEERATPRFFPVGVGLLLLVIAGTLAWHGASTLELRSRWLSSAGEIAKQSVTEAHHAYGFQNRGQLALGTRGITANPLPTNFEDAVSYVVEQMAASSGPMLILVDRSIQDGMPATLRELRARQDAGATPVWPGLKILFQEGSVYLMELKR